MRSAQYITAIAALVAPTFAQTFTDCQPLEKSCPPETALGKSVAYDFTKGAPSDFTAAAGTPPKFGSTGGLFSIAKSGDAPTLSSNWRIMFGHVKVIMKPAPGAGIVSSVVLQSSDLDEIDLEWVGSDVGTFQTNYFGKGNATTYDRGANFKDPSSADGFNTYEVDWTSTHLTWSINTNVVRTLTPNTADFNQYPQTPMQLKLGSWVGGDSKDQGTRDWAGGAPDWSKAPFNMIVKSVEVTDYSTGTQYTYSDKSGSWSSIKSTGGQIKDSGSAPSSVSTASASGTTLTGKATASAISQQQIQTSTSAVPTGQFGSGTGTGVAAPTASGATGTAATTRASSSASSNASSNATVGTTPTTSSAGGAATTSSSVVGAGSMVKPASALLFAGLFAIFAL